MSDSGLVWIRALRGSGLCGRTCVCLHTWCTSWCSWPPSGHPAAWSGTRSWTWRAQWQPFASYDMRKHHKKTKGGEITLSYVVRLGNQSINPTRLKWLNKMNDLTENPSLFEDKGYSFPLRFYFLKINIYSILCYYWWVSMSENTRFCHHFHWSGSWAEISSMVEFELVTNMCLMCLSTIHCKLINQIPTDHKKNMLAFHHWRHLEYSCWYFPVIDLRVPHIPKKHKKYCVEMKKYCVQMKTHCEGTRKNFPLWHFRRLCMHNCKTSLGGKTEMTNWEGALTAHTPASSLGCWRCPTLPWALWRPLLPAGACSCQDGPEPGGIC